MSVFFSGMLLGINIRRYWKENWSIGVGIDYTAQNEKYEFEWLDFDEGYERYDYNFKYIKLPVFVQWDLELSSQAKWSLFFRQGVQLSYLASYRAQRDTKFQMGAPSEGYELTTDILTNGKKIQKRAEGVKIFDGIYRPYHRFVLRLTGGVGVRKELTENWSLHTYVYYDFDLTNSDKKGIPFQGDISGTIHNFRLGLSLGVSYKFTQSPFVKGIL